MTYAGFIGVVCGLKSEARTAARAIGEASARIGVSGADAGCAENIAKEFCADGARAIVSFGVSGGLDPALKPGDLLIGETVLAEGGAVWSADADLLRAVRQAAAGIRSVCGPLYGADAVIDSAAEKARLFQEHGALAVDMESHGAARAASGAGVPFIAIRAVADPADRALPPAALKAVAPDGSTRTLATLGAALRDPKQFPQLLTLGADSQAALKTLSRDFGLLFAALTARLGL